MEFDRGIESKFCKVFVLRRPRAELHRRIDVRVRRMFDLGLVREVQMLLDRWKSLGQTASQAVGYREVIQLLAGERDMASTVERVLARTRAFARHQETWFRGMSECRIIDLAAGDDEREIARRVIQNGQSVSNLMNE
jgi:tRNA dimethylallyltransferase